MSIISDIWQDEIDDLRKQLAEAIRKRDEERAKVSALKQARKDTAFAHMDRIKQHEITNYYLGKKLEETEAQRDVLAKAITDFFEAYDASNLERDSYSLSEWRAETIKNLREALATLERPAPAGRRN